MASSGSIKKKNFNEKEILDFFSVIEDKLSNEELKMKEFIEIINQENNTK